MINRKKITTVISVVILIVILGFLSYYFYLFEFKTQLEEINHNPCLSDDESVDYPIDEEYPREAKIPKLPLIISIRDKNTNQEKLSFQIDLKTVGPPILKVRHCGIYVVRAFNYDPNKTKQESGFKEELWKYQYNGNGSALLLLVEKDEKGIFKSYYATHFNIDPQEKYLILERGYVGEDEYASVIKDLNSKNDLFVLRLKDILNQYSDVIPGTINLGSEWSEDGKYLFGDIFSGALDIAYYRIEMESWNVDIFPPPPDLLAGVERAINYKKWHLAYVDIPNFTGFREIYEQIIEEAKKEGKQKNLFIYNLRTKEKTKIVSVNPEWRFNLNWISDTELEYELPTGEKKIYEIEK